MNKLFMTLAALGLMSQVSVGSAAATMEFQYGDGQVIKNVGTAKKEAYDVAIYLPGIIFNGMVITGLKVPVVTENISEYSLWLTSELGIENINGKNVNITDIFTGEPNIVNGTAYIELDEPYEVSELGVYAGFSFKVDELNHTTSHPIIVSEPANENGLFLHTSRSYRKWMNMSERVNACSRLTVEFESSAYENSMNITNIPAARMIVGEPSTMTVTVANSGSNAINSLGYELEIDGMTTVDSISLPYPIYPSLDRLNTIKLPIPPVSMTGKHDLRLKLTKVNGMDNNSTSPEATGIVNVLAYKPVHRPLLEEYTGTWCGWCVRGIAAIEHMYNNYPDDFIGVAIHWNDEMEVSDGFPVGLSSLPQAYMDRAYNLDPYYGLSNTGFNLDQEWEERKEVLSPVDISLTSELQIDNTSVVDVNLKASVKYLEVPESEQRVVFMLVKDGVQGPGDNGWGQQNYYSGNGASNMIPEMDRFIDGPGMLSNFTFDDVLVLQTPYDGSGHTIESIELNEEIELTHSFNDILASKSSRGNSLITDTKGLSAVVAIIDSATGEIVNAARCEVNDETAIDGISADKEVITTTYYDLQGRQLDAPVSGLVIKKDVHTDGTVTVSKVIL